MKKIFKKKKTTIDTVKNIEENILTIIRSNDYDSLKKLLQQNPDIIDYTYGDLNRTLLHIACEVENEDMVELLLKSGADPNATDQYGKTPFHVSASGNSISIFNIFLKRKGIDISKKCKIGNNVLHCIAHKKTTIIDNDQLMLLVKRGVDINSQNCDLDTPLHICCKHGNVTLVELLVTMDNLDLTLVNIDNFTPIDIALSKKYDDIVKLLKSYKISHSSNELLIETKKTKFKESRNISPSRIKIHPHKEFKKHKSLSNVKTKLSKSFSSDTTSYESQFHSLPGSLNESNYRERSHSFNQASNRILIMDEYSKKEETLGQDVQIQYREAIETELIHEFEVMLGRDFILEVVEKILESKSFKWRNKILKNKIEILKWITDFLDYDKKQEYLRYLKVHYSSDIKIIKKSAKKHQRLLTLREKKIVSFDWEIDSRDIVFGEILGIGSFGSVYKGKLKSTGEDVAIKQLVDVSDEHIATFVKEITILSGLKHSNIVQFKGASLENNMVLVMEYAELGDLKSYLKRTKLPVDAKVRIARDIAKGMEFLHGQPSPIVHRDLKCQNILVNANGCVKVSDFGLSKLTTKTMTVGSKIGSLNWLAPEVLRGDDHASTYVDVYAFAMVMYEILTDGETPFEKYSTIQLIKAIDDGERPEIPEDCDPNYKSIMEKCWVDNPLERPTFTQLKEELKILLGNLKQTIKLSSPRKSPTKKRLDESIKEKKKPSSLKIMKKQKPSSPGKTKN